MKTTTPRKISSTAVKGAILFRLNRRAELAEEIRHWTATVEYHRRGKETQRFVTWHDEPLKDAYHRLEMAKRRLWELGPERPFAQ